MVTTTTTAEDWSAVAAAWDGAVDYVDAHSASATAALIEAVEIGDGDRVLELAAGPGSLGPTWSAATGPRGRVVLSDLAPGMVDVAARRNADRENVDTAVIDAAAIAYPDASFDVIVRRMGLMFTPEPAAALAEIHRVLASCGRFGAMTWASIEHNPWMTCVGMAAMMNGLVAGGPPVGPGGIFSLGEPEMLRALTEAAGFEQVKVEPVDITFHADSIDAHIAQVSALAGPLAAAFKAADETQLATVRQTAAQLAADHTTDGGLDLPGRALLLTARRP